MKLTLTRRRALRLGLGLIAIFLAADAFIPPPVHEVHSIGGTALNAAGFVSNNLLWVTGPPTQTLSDVRCVQNTTTGRVPCTSAEVAAVFPGLAQRSQTLYVVWAGCLDWSGAGPVIPWEGHNIEWFPGSRTIVFHCYTAKPWLYFPERLMGLATLPAYVLVAVPTAGMGPGPITIIEDDRLEHLVGDQSTEYQLATAQIS